jgi:probable FeS assembly SUF system protein SufT
MNEQIKLSRECEVLEIPSGARRVIPAGTAVRISQSLGDSYTVEVGYGGMYRVDGKDADALGLAVSAAAKGEAQTELSEKAIWDVLRTVFDPEIPVNIVDMGLIYGCAIVPLDGDDYRVDIKMTLTAPGCGMSDVLKADVERKISRLQGVKEVKVEVVFFPTWDPSRMSEAAKLQLGFDLDESPSESALPMFRPGR